MKRGQFLLFVGPSVAMMVLFIALPLLSVLWQSFHQTRVLREPVELETCSPGFVTQTCTTEIRSIPVLDADGRPVTETDFIGWSAYDAVLEPAAAWAALRAGDWQAFTAIDFWGALRFTLTFTFITLPLVIGLGLAIALAVNATLARIRGPVIFVSLLPFIITPVIGALSIRWLFVGDGILTRLMEHWSGTDISMFAQGWTIEILMIFYRVWHVAPFAFVIFYAGLQTVNRDTIEAAAIDGASRMERLRYVVIPSLMPLITFVALIHLMDAYRVFEEIVGFRSEAHVISLQYLTYDLLTPDATGNRAITRASASAMLTMVGIVILLFPLLRRTWADHRRARS
ncbi:MAG: sugar ABC transporter permease [Rubellimicrobium sp.]|nr:sugar ABC transporter permease [Rubellimicrobium sp.]